MMICISEGQMEHLRRKTLLFAGITAAVYIVLFLFIDAPTDLWVRENCGGTFIEELAAMFSYMGDGSLIRLGLALGFLLILAVDPLTKHKWTRSLLFICVSCAVALVVGEGLKFLLARHRPVLLFENGNYGLSFFSSDWASNSSPSGHTLRVFAILTATSMLFRKLTPVFLSLAVLIGLSRIIVTDHYPSDVVFGAYIGVFAALWVYRYMYSGSSISSSSGSTEYDATAGGTQ